MQHAWQCPSDQLDRGKGTNGRSTLSRCTQDIRSRQRGSVPRLAKWKHVAHAVPRPVADDLTQIDRGQHSAAEVDADCSSQAVGLGAPYTIDDCVRELLPFLSLLLLLLLLPIPLLFPGWHWIRSHAGSSRGDVTNKHGCAAAFLHEVLCHRHDHRSASKVFAVEARQTEMDGNRDESWCASCHGGDVGNSDGCVSNMPKAAVFVWHKASNRGIKGSKDGSRNCPSYSRTNQSCGSRSTRCEAPS
mmetsp:Transcript_11777/g.31982  ORF Transcript_11777/g.31982 Transcript_11777/m.31982 type:complete len:245 (+) Transcript_11777:120-854(+)